MASLGLRKRFIPFGSDFIAVPVHSLVHVLCTSHHDTCRMSPGLWLIDSEPSTYGYYGINNAENRNIRKTYFRIISSKKWMEQEGKNGEITNGGCQEASSCQKCSTVNRFDKTTRHLHSLKWIKRLLRRDISLCRFLSKTSKPLQRPTLITCLYCI